MQMSVSRRVFVDAARGSNCATLCRSKSPRVLIWYVIVCCARTDTAHSCVFARSRQAGQCIECEERKAVLDCNECQDEFCAVCFSALHRKGKRAQHK